MSTAHLRADEHDRRPEIYILDQAD